jgi:hypothetical protein
LSENRAAGPSADLIGRKRRPKGDSIMINFGFRVAGRAARLREAAAEVLVFVWGASVLCFCVLIMALYFLV